MSQTTNESDPGISKVAPDPGWNDPPLFSYDTTQAVVQSGKKSVFLNKRVAYPLNSKSSSPVVDKITPGMPPMPTAVSIRAPPMSPSVRSELTASTADTSTMSGAGEPVNLKDQEMLSSVMATFDEILDTSSEENERSKEEIKKRLGVLQKMWEEDKLNPDVCRKVYRLAEALRQGDTKLPDNIQAGLMVDHVALCRNWMAALRKLIHLVKIKAPASDQTN
ncbi:steroid receptor RNA activator 1 [Anabrus simplex]|uniref:steroid receptor RNA activator 1 n=1 Tax=Anabrus simplex TaxID=316456 RepID=UPI0035A2FB7B